MPPVILCADDDEDAHFLLRKAFVQSGVEVVLKQVNDGSEAISYLEGRGTFSNREEFPLPDLLLLDLKMPRLSGFEVLEHFARSAPQRSFRVVVFSCSDNPEDVQRARALGCDSFLMKPSDFKGLVALVGSFPETLLAPGGIQTGSTQFPASEPRPPVMHHTKEKATMTPAGNPPNSPEMYHLLVEQVKDYAIFFLDPEGFVRSWNEGGRRIHGYEAHEMVGKHFSIFYPKADIESEKPAFELRMAREMGRYEEEGWRLRKDGSRFWADVVVTPLRDRGGALTGFAKITRDLTQRKFQEEQLQRLLESEERFRLLVDQVKDYAIFFLDARGNISSWNQGARRIKGYTADEIIGRHFSTFYTPEDLADDKPSRELTIAIREGRYEEEGWRVKKDGSRFWASVVITALWDKRGNLTGFAKVTRDLTDKKREEELLRARTRELEAFAHTLSHDLRAPIRSISSYAQLLTEENSQLSTADHKKYLDKIYNSAQSMDALVRDILKLSQVSLAPAATETVNVEKVLRESLEYLDREIRESKANIAVRSPLPPLQANRTLVFQIITNLLSNALKFSRPGEPPRVEIFSQVRDGMCEIHVKDRGVGIPPDIQKSIFEIFNRGRASSGSHGTGIGLAIAKKAAERFGGSISLVSSEGEGSDFAVTLPCDILEPAQV